MRGGRGGEVVRAIERWVARRRREGKERDEWR